MGLNRIDLLIIAAYLAGITLFGLRFRKRQRTMRDYFLADREIPWWAIALSIVAAETSTLTIISIPGLAYDSNLTFLQVVMGYVVGRVIISFVLLPQYFRGELYTAITTSITIPKTGFKYLRKNRAFETRCPMDNCSIPYIPCGPCISIQESFLNWQERDL